MNITIRRLGDSVSWLRLSWSAEHRPLLQNSWNTPSRLAHHGFIGCVCWNGWGKTEQSAFGRRWRHRAFS